MDGTIVVKVGPRGAAFLAGAIVRLVMALSDKGTGTFPALGYRLGLDVLSQLEKQVSVGCSSTHCAEALEVIQMAMEVVSGEAEEVINEVVDGVETAAETLVM